jgi:hypothetical protein
MVKMKKQIPLIVVTALLFSVAGCDSHQPKPGFYVGTNPYVSFYIVKAKNYNGTIYRIENLHLYLPPITYGGITDEDAAYIEETDIEPDGSFTDIENGEGFTGKIDGDVISGNYKGYREFINFEINGHFIKSIKLDPAIELDVNWSASLSGASPTSTPPPTPIPTAIPPKLGHYAGGDVSDVSTKVSFNVTASGVENFIFFNGIVREDGVMNIDPYGYFSVQDYSDTNIFGIIVGDVVYGGYSLPAGCVPPPGGICTYSPYDRPSGDWSAYWVSP